MLDPVPADVRACSRIISKTDQWLIGSPLEPLAMFWWGAFTEWCTASDAGIFHDYAARGALVVFRSRTTSFRWMLQPATGEFRDCRNRRASWRGFLMRHPAIAENLLIAVAENVAAQPSAHGQ